MLVRKEERGTVRPDEAILIQKYALLDKRGRMNVSAVLEHEFSLSQQLENKRTAT